MIIVNGLFAFGSRFLAFYRYRLVCACFEPPLCFANEFALREVTSGRDLSIEMPRLSDPFLQAVFVEASRP